MTSSEERHQHKYRLLFHPEALQEWNALDGSIKKPLKKLLAKRLDNPHVPGGALRDDLIGCYKIKLNKQGLRLVYRVEDDALIVMVMAVDRREDSLVYRSALARMVETVTTLATAAKKAFARDAPVRPAGRPANRRK
ncbi:MAG TPA: type II toxin-antitoxin system RelE/ParE family toxin [Steroidobacteraceae bacterium]|nr:type II toxin-antitoxin system RelE/ParE family toxin [Steroidobacteraceae bacterium]